MTTAAPPKIAAKRIGDFWVSEDVFPDSSMSAAIGADGSITLDPYGDVGNEEASLPNPTQAKTLTWWDKKRFEKRKEGTGIPVLYLQGGVGCGKTRAFAAVVFEALLEIPGIRLLWCRNDFNDLRLSAMETFIQCLPPELIQSKNVQ